MNEVVLLVVIIAGSIVIVAAVIYIYAFKVYIKNRRHPIDRTQLYPIKYIPDAVVAELPPEDVVADAKETRRDRIKRIKDNMLNSNDLTVLVGGNVDTNGDIINNYSDDIESGHDRSDTGNCCCHIFSHKRSSTIGIIPSKKDLTSLQVYVIEDIHIPSSTIKAHKSTAVISSSIGVVASEEKEETLVIDYIRTDDVNDSIDCSNKRIKKKMIKKVRRVGISEQSTLEDVTDIDISNSTQEASNDVNSMNIDWEHYHELEEELHQHIHEDSKKAEGISLFDVNNNDRNMELVQYRKKLRHLRHLKQAEDGIVDTVRLNAGPPAAHIPVGYKLSIRTLTDKDLDQSLCKSKVLVSWDGSEKNIHGWYLGTISSVSKVSPYNFNIKYDRSITKSQWVDGIMKISLRLSGIDAYGRKWVLLDRDDTVSAANDMGAEN